MKPTYHLYYRLPWHNASIGIRNCDKYTILRSDTEKIVCYASTEKEADKICSHFKKNGYNKRGEIK